MSAGGEDTVAREILASARSLLDRAAAETSGLWPRAAVLLQRQALKVALKTYWSADLSAVARLGERRWKAPGVEECSTRAQFLCLGTYLRASSGSQAEDVARRAHQAWAALSRAAHFHPYDLPPTREELLAWDEVVSEVIEATEMGWR